MSGEGRLAPIVWPTYLGVAEGLHGSPVAAPGGEPFWHHQYARGQIAWMVEGDRVVGRATVHIPPGEYGWFVFFFGPGIDHGRVGATRWEHPQKFSQWTVMDVYPIQYTELVPR